VSQNQFRNVSTDPAAKMIEGIDALRKAVGVTLGPMGQNVLIDPEYGQNPTHTKDGVTVARGFSHTDEIADSAAKTIITASLEMNTKVGDGTTSVVILAVELAKRILALPAGQKRRVVDTLETLYADATRVIASRSQDIQATPKSLMQVAMLACNHREDLATLVAETVAEVGLDGIATFQQSRSGQHDTEVTTGFHFDRGYLSPFFVQGLGVEKWDFEDCYILVYDGRMADARSVAPAINAAIGGKKNLLIIAADVEGEAVATCIVNNAKGQQRIVAVKAPKFGSRRTDVLQDIAMVTDAQVYNDSAHGDIARTEPGTLAGEFLGTAARVIVTGGKTVIVGGSGDEVEIAERMETIRQELPHCDEMERMHTEERLARLAGGVGTIFVGGRNDAEIKANMFLVEDGIHACFAALRKGVVPAGGIAYKWALQVGKDFEPSNIDEQTAKDIFLHVVQAPLEQLVSNALEAGTPKTETYRTISEMLGRGKNVGFNILTGQFEDFRSKKIVEPTILSIEALKTSFGCGSILGTTAAALTKPRDAK